MKLPFNRKICNHFFKSQMHIRIILEFFEKYKCPGTAFIFARAPDMSYEQPYLKTAGLLEDLLLLSSLFHFFLFHMQFPHFIQLIFSNFPISSFSFDVLSQDFIKHSRKAFVYICITNMYNIYFRKQTFLSTKNL